MPTRWPHDIGRRLAAARAYAGISNQATLAEALGVGQTTVQRYEAGKIPGKRSATEARVADDLIERWAVECGVPMSWLKEPWDGPPVADPEDRPVWVGEFRDQLRLIAAVLTAAYPEQAATAATALLGDSADPPAAPARRKAG